MADNDVSKPKRDRSPAFPFIALRRAVERAQALYENHRREPARLAAVAPSWGYSAKSSGLLQTAAALKQFGLVEDMGSGDDRKILLTKLGQTIVADQRPGAREMGLKEAARSPAVIAEYLSKWLPDRPSDAHCVSELHLDRGFTEEAAKAFLRTFDETVSYANLADDALSDPEPVEGAAASGAADDGPMRQSWHRPADTDFIPAAPRGPRPLNERMKIAIDGKTLAITANLETETEVDQMIAILSANKVLLPKESHKIETPAGAGAINMD